MIYKDINRQIFGSSHKLHVEWLTKVHNLFTHGKVFHQCRAAWTGLQAVRVLDLGTKVGRFSFAPIVDGKGIESLDHGFLATTAFFSDIVLESCLITGHNGTEITE